MSHSLVSDRDFLRQVEVCLNEEQRLSEQFCHPSSITLLRSRCEDALIVKHLDVIYSLSDLYLRDSKEEELRLVYRLLSRVPGALKPVQDSLKAILIERGNQSLSPFKQRIESNMMPTSPLLSGKQEIGKERKEQLSGLEKSMMEYDALAEQEAESFVNTAWNIYIHSKKLVEEAFLNDEGFVLALEQGCNKFVNGVSSAPHLLARFCHKVSFYFSSIIMFYYIMFRCYNVRKAVQILPKKNVKTDWSKSHVFLDFWKRKIYFSVFIQSNWQGG